MSLSMAVTGQLVRTLPRTTASAEAVLRRVGGDNDPAPPNAAIRRVATIETRVVDGFTVYELTPKRGATGAHLVYTHGGCYAYALLSTHWTLLATLMRDSGVSVTLPLYGLTPQHQAHEAYALLDRLYDEAVAAHGGRVYLAGDSAGGGLAAGQAQRYRDTGRTPPAGVLLFSPWLDATMTNPGIAAVEPHDHMLGVAGLVACGRWWAGESDPASPPVSPVNGDLGGLPPIVTYQGGRDILAPDAKRFTRGVRAAGGEATMLFYPGAFHVFVGAPWTPEARRALLHASGVLASTVGPGPARNGGTGA